MKQLKIENCKVLSEYGDACYLETDNKHQNSFLAVERVKNPTHFHLFVWNPKQQSLVTVYQIGLALLGDVAKYGQFDEIHEIIQEKYLNSSHYATNDVEITENGDFFYAGEEYYIHLGSNMA